LAPNGAGDDAHTEDDHGKSGKIEEGAQQEEGEFAQARGGEVRQEGQEKGQCPQVGGTQGNAQDGRQEGAPQSDGEEGLSQRRSEEIGAQGCCQAQGSGPQGEGEGEGARKACRGAQTRRSETGRCADASAAPDASSATGGSTGAQPDDAAGHVTQQLLNAVGLFHQG
jgi:hypothetical protein